MQITLEPQKDHKRGVLLTLASSRGCGWIRFDWQWPLSSSTKPYNCHHFLKIQIPTNPYWKMEINDLFKNQAPPTQKKQNLLTNNQDCWTWHTFLFMWNSAAQKKKATKLFVLKSFKWFSLGTNRSKQLTIIVNSLSPNICWVIFNWICWCNLTLIASRNSMCTVMM